MCKLRFYWLCIARLKLVNHFLEKQDMLPVTLPDIESEIVYNKNIPFAKIT